MSNHIDTQRCIVKLLTLKPHLEEPSNWSILNHNEHLDLKCNGVIHCEDREVILSYFTNPYIELCPDSPNVVHIYNRPSYRKMCMACRRILIKFKNTELKQCPKCKKLFGETQ